MLHPASLFILTFCAVLVAGSAVLAEPLNYDGLGRGLLIGAICILAYLVLFVLLIVFAVKRQRRKLLITALIGGAIAIGFPALDAGLLAYQKARVSAAEIRKDTPDLAAEQILLISTRKTCNYSLCEAMIKLRGGAPIYALRPDQVSDMDFTVPIDLSSIALIRLVTDPEGFNSFKTEPVGPGEARPDFTYVLIDRSPFYLSRASNIEQALTLMPSGTFLGDKLSLDALAAPIPDGRLDLATLQPDYLGFYNARNAFAIPLFLENEIYGSDLGYRYRRAKAGWFCPDTAGERQAWQCRDAIED